MPTRTAGDFATEDLSDLQHFSINIKLLSLIEEHRIWFQTAGPRSRLQPHNETVKAGYIAIYERLLELVLLITISIEKNSHFFSNLIVLLVYEKLVSTYRWIVSGDNQEDSLMFATMLHLVTLVVSTDSKSLKSLLINRGLLQCLISLACILLSITSSE